MSLPLNAIDRLFDRLLATYGRDFSARWEGLDQGAVKSSWAHELAGYESRLKPHVGNGHWKTSKRCSPNDQ